ncbi:InlB B-repeat-containing protein [Haploplasma axanthum]|nr:InlB B-repeat-containing protein [Haploplasma axanthum]
MKKVLLLISTLLLTVLLISCKTKVYTVTFNSDGGSSVAKEEVKKGDLATKPDNPTKDNYDFQFWVDEDNKEWIFTTRKVEKDTTLKATWKEKTPVVEKFKLTLSEGLSSNQANNNEIAKGTAVTITVTVPVDKQIKTFTVNGTDQKNNISSNQFKFNIMANTTIVLVLENKEAPVEKVTVEFILGYEGTAIPNQEINKGAKATKPTNPVREGYNFLGWTTVENGTALFNFEAVVNANQKLYAKWEIKTFEVTLITGDTETKQTIAFNGNIAFPVTTKAGYTFVGWFIGDNEFDVATKVTSNLTITTKWEVLEYTITYELDGGTNHTENPLKYTIENDTITLLDPTRTGYIFDGWYDGEEKVTQIETTRLENVTLEARWTEKEPDVTYFDVIFNSNEGSLVSSQEIKEGETVTKPVNPTKEGHTFVEWQLNGVTYNFATPVTEELTLVAKWEINTFEITIDLKDGTTPTTQTVNWNETVTLTDPVRAGYTFVKWISNGIDFTTETPITSELLIEVVWEVTEYTITYELDGGTNHTGNPLKYTIENDTITLLDPTRAGYIFNGWYDGEEKVTQIKTTRLEDIILEARWTEKDPDVTYEAEFLAKLEASLEEITEAKATLDGRNIEVIFSEGVEVAAVKAAAERLVLALREYAGAGSTITVNGTEFNLATVNVADLARAILDGVNPTEFLLEGKDIVVEYSAKVDYLRTELNLTGELVFGVEGTEAGFLAKLEASLEEITEAKATLDGRNIEVIFSEGVEVAAVKAAAERLVLALREYAGAGSTITVNGTEFNLATVNVADLARAILDGVNPTEFLLEGKDIVVEYSAKVDYLRTELNLTGELVFGVEGTEAGFLAKLEASLEEITEAKATLDGRNIEVIFSEGVEVAAVKAAAERLVLALREYAGAGSTITVNGTEFNLATVNVADLARAILDGVNPTEFLLEGKDIVVEYSAKVDYLRTELNLTGELVFGVEGTEAEFLAKLEASLEEITEAKATLDGRNIEVIFSEGVEVAAVKAAAERLVLALREYAGAGSTITVNGTEFNLATVNVADLARAILDGVNPTEFLLEGKDIVVEYSAKVDYLRTELNLTGELVFGVEGTARAVSISNENQLRLALSNPKISTIELSQGFNILSSVKINRAVTINGNGHALDFSSAVQDSNNSFNHGIIIQSSNVIVKNLVVDSYRYGFGIQIFNRIGVVIENVTVSNSLKGGILVNSSEVMVKNVTLQNNVWGGIEVSEGKTGTVTPKLTVEGTITYIKGTSDAEAIIWIDGKLTNDEWVVGSNLKQVEKTVSNNREQRWFVEPIVSVTAELTGEIRIVDNIVEYQIKLSNNDLVWVPLESNELTYDKEYESKFYDASINLDGLVVTATFEYTNNHGRSLTQSQYFYQYMLKVNGNNVEGKGTKWLDRINGSWRDLTEYIREDVVGTWVGSTIIGEYGVVYIINDVLYYAVETMPQRYYATFKVDNVIVEYRGQKDNQSLITGSTKGNKDGYEFLGWFDEETDELFDFGQPLTKNVVLVAKHELITEANVANQNELLNALRNENIVRINLLNGFEVTESLKINRKLTIDGKGHALDFSNAIQDTNPSFNHGIIVQSNDVILKDLIVDSYKHGFGIQIFNRVNVVIDTVSVLNSSKGGILVNSSEVTIRNIVLENNIWGGIEVSKGKTGSRLPKLTVDGIIKFESAVLPAVWIDKVGEIGDDLVEGLQLNSFKPFGKDQIWFVAFEVGTKTEFLTRFNDLLNQITAANVELSNEDINVNFNEGVDINLVQLAAESLINALRENVGINSTITIKDKTFNLQTITASELAGAILEDISPQEFLENGEPINITYTALVDYESVEIKLNGTIRFEITPLSKEFSLVYGVTGNGSIVGLTNQILVEGTLGEEVTAVPNEGYFFSHWSDGDTNPVRRDRIVYGDKSITAVFLIYKYEVKFLDYNNQIIKSEEVEYGESAIAPENPTRIGYTFKGWSVEFSRITKNIEVKTIYEINKYVVRFIDHDDKLLVEVEVEHGEIVVYPKDEPTRFRTQEFTYSFLEWDKDLTEVLENTTYKAVYSEIRNKYEVVFIDYNNVTLKSEEVEYGKSAIAPEEPNRLGYTFVSWNKDFTNITEETEIFAVYEINKYIVKFIDYDETKLKEQIVDYGLNANAPALTFRRGFKHIGWDKEFISVTENIEVRALYEDVIFIGEELNDNYYVVNRVYNNSTIKTESIGLIPIVFGSNDISSNYTFEYKDSTGKKITTVNLADGATTFVFDVIAKSELYDDFSGRVVIKYQSVTIGNTDKYMTIEDAINIAKSGDVIFVRFNTSFSKENIANEVYGKTTFQVKQGVTLLLPFNAELITTLNETNTAAAINRNAGYVKLNVTSGINIEVIGTFTVNAQRSHASTRFMGFVTGANYSMVRLENESSLNVLKNGQLNVIGFIYGDGEINIENGAKVLETMFIQSFRGGSATFNVQSDVFPFDQFTVNNIESKMNIKSGSIYRVSVLLYMSSSFNFAELEIIGTSSTSLIKINEGFVEKKYNSLNGEITLSLYGNAELNNAVVKVGGITASSSGKDMPFDGKWHFNLKSGSVLQINSYVSLLPGATITVEENAELNISTSGRLTIFNPYQYILDGTNAYTKYGDTAVYNRYRMAPKFDFNNSTIAELNLKGRLNVEGGIAGRVNKQENGIIDIKDNAKTEYTINYVMGTGSGANVNSRTVSYWSEENTNLVSIYSNPTIIKEGSKLDLNIYALVRDVNGIAINNTNVKFIIDSIGWEFTVNTDSSGIAIASYSVEEASGENYNVRVIIDDAEYRQEVKVTKSSGESPFLYSVDSNGNVIFEHEPFPFSMLESIEGTTYGSLRYLEEVNGEYIIRVVEEGTSVTTLKDTVLYVFDYSDEDILDVVFDINGNVQTIKNYTKPISFVDENNNSMIENVLVKDGNYALKSEQNLGLIYYDAMFKRSEYNSFAKLIISARELGKSMKMFNDVTSSLGSIDNLWLMDQLFNKNNDSKISLNNIFETLELEIQLKVNGTWIKQGSIQPKTYLDENQIIELDLSNVSDEYIVVRLVMPGVINYGIDYIAIDFSLNSKVEVKEAKLKKSVYTNKYDIKTNFVTGTELVYGEYVDFYYEVPVKDEKNIRKFGVETTGYIYAGEGIYSQNEKNNIRSMTYQELVNYLVVNEDENIFELYYELVRIGNLDKSDIFKEIFELLN